MKRTVNLFTHKSIGYSYASSTNAKKFGFDKEGCWTVNLYVDANTTIGAKYLKAFATKEEALSHAASLPQPYTKWHAKYIV